MNIITWLKDNLTGELDERDVQRVAARVQNPQVRVTWFGLLWGLFIIAGGLWLLGTCVHILDSAGFI